MLRRGVAAAPRRRARAARRAAAAGVVGSRNLDWGNMLFDYVPTNGHMEYTWKDGKWDDGLWVDSPTVNLHIMSGVLHYGQALFEGMKAFHCKDGEVRYFQPDDANQKRMETGCRRIMIPVVDSAMFNGAICRALKGNLDYMPPYGSGGSMYVRPFAFGCGPKLGLGTAPEFKFIVMVNPVGSYYKGALQGVDGVVVEGFDRAAPKGVGAVKVGGNYAADLVPAQGVKDAGYIIGLYLDAQTRSVVEEFSTSNFVAITKDGAYVTPKSPSILPSVTNKALKQIARDMGLRVEERAVPWDEVPDLAEVGACGTAVVLTPLNSLTRGDRKIEFGGYKTLQELRNRVVAIQTGEAPDTHGWCRPLSA